MLTETGPLPALGAAAASAAAGEFPAAAEKSAAGRVLVVDDERLIRWTVAQTLGPLGYEVVEAGTGAEAARRLLDDAPFTAVLLDLQLPDCADLRLLRVARQAAPATPVVLMTAYATPEIEQEAVALGAARVLRKPFELDALVGLMDILGRDERPDDPGR